PAIWWDATSGVGYAIYATVSSKTSYLNVMNLSTGAVSQTKLGFTPSSNIAIDESSAQMFVADNQGNFYTAFLSPGMTASTLMGSGNYTTGTAHTAGVAVSYIGYTQSGATRYIWTTSTSEIDVYKLDANGWSWVWTSAIGSSATAAKGALASDPGTSGKGPQFLPAGADITDLSVTAAGILIVPVTTQSGGSSETSCDVGQAQYYLYNLNDGSFPVGQFHDSTGASITINPIIGQGRAYSAVVANINSSTIGGLAIYGSAQQSTSGNAAFSLVMTAPQSSISGIVGVRRTMMQTK
ncbi:MAG: hypothetical protein PF483_14145, partial [Halothiobacillus sp.]|nr:hypothetical protein [Halothiobacillus sp.]